MQGRKLIFADGTEYNEGEAGYSEGHLWLYLPPGADVAQVFADVTNPAKTERITFVYGESRDEYVGFTDFRGITLDTDNNLRVHLTKPRREEG